MVLGASLGDIVQERSNVEGAAVLNRFDDGGGERVRLSGRAVLDVRQNADGADQMLVHGVVMVHVELHHGHDLAEVRHESAEHACFVHAPQGRFGVFVRAQHCQEDAVGFGVVAQLVVNEAQRAAQ
jgi:hypothetical protein